MVHLVEFPMEAIELNIETSHHPELIKALNELLIEVPNADFYIRLARIAAYCGIVVDGEYYEEEIRGLCKLCTQRLQEMRTLILMPHSTNLH